MATNNNGAFGGAGSIQSIIGGPSGPTPPESLGAVTPEIERLLEKVSEDAELAAHSLQRGQFTPHRGETRTPDTPLATASSTAEDISSRKLGDGAPDIGENPLNGPLDRERDEDSGRELTSSQGVKVADNQDSLKIGLRGSTAMEDFIFREKITHFDYERIPSALPNGEPDPGLIVADPAGLNAALATFKAAVTRHKIYVRESDSPRV